MERLSKTRTRKELLYDSLISKNEYMTLDIEKLYSMNIISGNGYSVWGFKIPSQLIDGEVLCVVPDGYYNETELQRWGALYKFALSCIDKLPKDKQWRVRKLTFVLLATPNDNRRIEPVYTRDPRRILKKSAINRGYTSLSLDKDGKKIINSVVFHQSAERGVVMFHELFHVLMIINNTNYKMMIDTPWGQTSYMEILAELYGNIMTLRHKKDKRKHIMNRINVYKGQSLQFVRLLNEWDGEVQIQSNYISYLCGTYVMLNKMCDRLSWRQLYENPELLLSRDVYNRYGPKLMDWQRLSKQSQSIKLSQFVYFTRV